MCNGNVFTWPTVDQHATLLESSINKGWLDHLQEANGRNAEVILIEKIGTPERIRTSDLLLRRQTLYPG
jgi:hypothetical protein